MQSSDYIKTLMENSKLSDGNYCPLCIKKGTWIKLELTESMMLICSGCSRCFIVKSNGKRELFYEDNS